MTLVIYQDCNQIYQFDDFPAKPCIGESIFIDCIELQVKEVSFDVTDNGSYLVNIEVRQI